MNILLKLSQISNSVLVKIGGLFLIGMILLTCSNIFLRLVWFPIRGTFELMGFFGAMVTAFALGYTQLAKGHIAVDVLVDTFSAGSKRIIQFVNSLLCTIFAVLCAWQLVVKANTLWETGEVTETLQIIYWPFTYGAAVGLAFLGLVFVFDLMAAIFPAKEDIV